MQSIVGIHAIVVDTADSMADAASRPTVEPARAAALARQHWGLDGELHELGSYADRNFRLDAADGRRFVFKLSRDTPDILELQAAALAQLSTRPSAGLVPRVIPTLDKRTWLAALDDDSQPFTLRMLSWLDGKPWSELDPPSAAQRQALGRTLAQLDIDLVDFRHPAMHRSLRWRLPEADWIADELGVIADRWRRSLVIDALAQFQARVVPLLGALPHQLIHGDAHEDNLLVAGDEPCGIFDFGDTNVAPAICELAIAAAYIGMVPDSIEAIAELCVGWHARRSMSTLELDLLFDLMRARLAVSVVNSALAHGHEPDDTYVTASESRAWSLLGKLTEFGRRAVTRFVADACDLAPPDHVVVSSSRSRLLSRRRIRMSPAQPLSYAEPLYIRRGRGSWLFDEHDHGLLDCVNNIAHVGHCHPRVVAAGRRQAELLDTNTRYLHENVLIYAERLCSMLPRSLSVVFMVCSGSEANELALRLARAYTGGRDVIVVDGAYHGNTNTLIDISPYKFDGPGGQGRREWVHVIDTPDPYRGKHGNDGLAYAEQIVDVAERVAAGGSKLAAFVCESVLGCAGQIVPAKGFLRNAYAEAREAGAVCIADEVQVGFGRVGDSMWGFEAEGVIPDIVTLGKPIANGHPVGAVVTRPEIAASLGEMEYFNSFGGNPVSCAIALAVLDVLDDEALIENARRTGRWLRQALAELDDPGIGDVRGRGLFLGVELVDDRETKAPAAARCTAVVEYARERGVLLSVDGPRRNVIKIKPPMCFGLVEAKLLVHTLAGALRAIPVK